MNDLNRKKRKRISTLLCKDPMRKMWKRPTEAIIDLKMQAEGAPGWLSQLSKSHFGSGHDLTACEFEPCAGLCADSSEPGTCFRFCISLCLCPSPAHTHSLALKNKH